MNRYFVIPVAFLTAILLFVVSDASSEDVNVFHGVQYASVSNSKLKSSTMTISNDGGVFKTVVSSGDVLALTPGEKLVSSFKLPDNSDHINVTIDFYASNDSAKGLVRWNGVLLSGKEYEMSKNSQEDFSSVNFLLNDAQAQNELKIFSVEGELCIHRIKIDYDYRMPSCSKHNVTVVLTSPVSNTDAVQQDMCFKWKTIGDCKNGWISLQYLDNRTWKTVPGAELLDCQAQKTSGKYGEFIWKDHGLSAIPKIRIEYYDYQNDPLPKQCFSRKMRPFVLEKSVNVWKLIERFLDEDIELLNSIVLINNKIMVFKPTERTWEEYRYRIAIDAVERDLIVHSGNNTLVEVVTGVKEVKEIIEKLHDLEEQRFDKDFTITLLVRTSIDNNLNSFKILDNSISELEEHVRKIAEDNNRKKEIQKKIENFKSIVEKKKRDFISYSIVSPYLSNMERIRYWQANHHHWTVSKTYSQEGLEMIRFIIQKDLIRNCYDDVKIQYNDLLKKYPSLKDDFKLK